MPRMNPGGYKPRGVKQSKGRTLRSSRRHMPRLTKKRGR